MWPCVFVCLSVVCWPRRGPKVNIDDACILIPVRPGVLLPRLQLFRFQGPASSCLASSCLPLGSQDAVWEPRSAAKPTCRFRIEYATHATIARMQQSPLPRLMERYTIIEYATLRLPSPCSLPTGVDIPWNVAVCRWCAALSRAESPRLVSGGRPRHPSKTLIHKKKKLPHSSGLSPSSVAFPHTPMSPSSGRVMSPKSSIASREVVAKRHPQAPSSRRVTLRSPRSSLAMTEAMALGKRMRRHRVVA